MRIPVYITNRNLLSPVRGMIDYLANVPGAEPKIIDCASSYPPLLDWYDKGCPVPVVRLPDNRGPRAAWYFIDPQAEYFVVSDGDFDLTGIPTDCLDVLRQGLERYPAHLKAGFSQRIDDLPETPLKGSILEQEKRFWQKRVDALFWEGEIDSAFALYRRSYRPYWWGKGGPLGHFGPSLLADQPYQMRHLSWYVTPETLTDEWRYALAHASEMSVVWTPQVRKYLKINPVADPHPVPRPWEK